MPFVILSGWSQYGQWGHMEYLHQPIDEAPKYEMLIEFYDLDMPEGY